jgi:nitrate/nitrite transport system ATP-binding protein
MSFLELSGVSKALGAGAQRKQVLEGINLRIEQGEVVAVVGCSGAGKTTLLNLIAGLLMPDEGEVRFEGNPVRGPGPDRAVMFQSYALLPWLSVEGNVALAVDQVFPNLTPAVRKARVLEFVEKVHLTPARRKRPKELSGGMRQRVALARALAMEPRLLLLDEPLGALDALTRAELQGEIAQLCRANGTTALLITNDIDEALLLADRVLPLAAAPRAPGVLAEEIKVALPSPRDRKVLIRDAQFLRLRSEVLKALHAARAPRPQPAPSLPLAAPAGALP